MMLDFGFYNLDCMEGMRQFPDKYFDLAIVDPPYGDAGGGGALDRKDSEECSTNTARRISRESLRSNVSRTGGTWAAKFGKKLFRGTWRRKRNISTNFSASHVIRLYGGGNYFELPPTRCFLIWRKTHVPENFTMAMCEYAWTSFNANAKMFEFSAVGQSGRFHPTQKPIELYKWIISNYANEGDTILDTHVGSASSLIACHQTGHKFVGFEIDPGYYEKAKSRLEVAQSQLSLFDIGEL